MKLTVVLMMLFACIGLLCSGCGTRWERSAIVDRSNIHVSLEHRVVEEKTASRQFNHPFDMDPAKLGLVLSQLQYKEPPRFYGEWEQVPVFQATEIQNLVPALVDALAKARSEQRVRFISYNKGGGMLFKKIRRTGGVLFLGADNRLNLALSYVNHEMTGEVVQGAQTDALFSDPLIIDSAEKSVLVSADAIHHRTKNGETMPLWIVADLEQIKASGMPAVSSDESGAEGPDTAGRGKPAGAPASRVEGAPADREKEQVSGPAASGRQERQDESADDTWERRKDDIKEKLKYLKELHDSDLITTEEYKARKKKLLEQIQ